MYQAFSGVPAGTWEPGIYDYKALPRSGAQVFENSTTVASYSYSSSAREVVSYDTPSIVTKKVAYALSKGTYLPHGSSSVVELTRLQVSVVACTGSLAPIRPAPSRSSALPLHLSARLITPRTIFVILVSSQRREAKPSHIAA